MKRLKLLAIVASLLCLLFSTAMVLASPAAIDEGLKPGKTVTPGAKATEKAAERVPDQPGKKNEPQKPPEKAPGPKDKDPKAPKGVPQTYQGTVDSAGAGSLSLELAGGEIVTFTISPTTTVKINIPGVPHATLSDVEVGARARVQVRKMPDGALAALSLQVLAPKPAKQQRVGIVIEYIPGVSITIAGKAGFPKSQAITTTVDITTTPGITTTYGVTLTHGMTTTYAITATTVILPPERANRLAVGVRVTIIAPSAAWKGGRLVAQGIVVHPSKPSDSDEMEPDK